MSHPDAVVLGGGIIGLACARELAAAGMRVEVLERLHQGAGASRAAAGMLGPLFEPDAPEPLLSAARESRDLWGDWAAALEGEARMGVDYDRSGALQFALADPDGADEAALAASVALAHRLGEPCTELAPAELRARTPGVATSIRRLVHFAGEHRVDNIRVCSALTAALERRGVAIRYASHVEEVTPLPAGSGGGPALRIETRDGPLDTGLLVLAAGAWSGRVPGLPPLPVRPVRGQMALLTGIAWPWKGIARRRDIYFVRRGAADVVVGATVEEAGFHSHPTPDGIASLLDRARQSYPGLGAVRLEAVWAGLRPGTPDALPIVGWLPDLPVLAATGHFRSGILLTPWTARQIALLATATAAPAAALAAFSPARFAA